MTSPAKPYSSQPVFRAFFIYAVALGTLFPRLGDIQIAMGVGEALLGLSILGLPVGLQISLLVADKLLRHFTMGQVMVAGTALIGCAYVGASLSPSPLYFFISLFFGGLSIGAMEVAVNLEADRVEAVIGRRIMNRAHAFWSLGFFTTGLLGALIAQLGITPFWHFLLLAVATTLFCSHYFLRYQQAPERASDAEATSLFVRPTKAIMVLVLLTLSAMLVEGSAIDWSVIFMRDIFQTVPLVSGLALALAALCQFVARYFADGYVERFGAQRIARLCLAIMLGGIIFVAGALHPVMALLGFAALGAGSSVIFPLAMSAAAQQTDRPAAVNVASLAQIAFVVFLLAPPLLGAIAEFAGIRYSYAVSLPLIILSFFFVHGLRALEAPTADASGGAAVVRD